MSNVASNPQPEKTEATNKEREATLALLKTMTNNSDFDKVTAEQKASIVKVVSPMTAEEKKEATPDVVVRAFVTSTITDANENKKRMEIASSESAQYTNVTKSKTSVPTTSTSSSQSAQTQTTPPPPPPMPSYISNSSRSPLSDEQSSPNNSKSPSTQSLLEAMSFANSNSKSTFDRLSPLLSKKAKLPKKLSSSLKNEKSSVLNESPSSSTEGKKSVLKKLFSLLSSSKKPEVSSEVGKSPKVAKITKKERIANLTNKMGFEKIDAKSELNNAEFSTKNIKEFRKALKQTGEIMKSNERKLDKIVKDVAISYAKAPPKDSDKIGKSDFDVSKTFEEAKKATDALEKSYTTGEMSKLIAQKILANPTQREEIQKGAKLMLTAATIGKLGEYGLSIKNPLVQNHLVNKEKSGVLMDIGQKGHEHIENLKMQRITRSDGAKQATDRLFKGSFSESHKDTSKVSSTTLKDTFTSNSLSLNTNISDSSGSRTATSSPVLSNEPKKQRVY